MLENKKIVRKIINILIVLVAITVMLGIYIKTTQTDIIEIETIAIDNLGLTKNETILLKAIETEKELYEIELPQNINTKEVNEITKVSLKKLSNEVQESINVEVVDNKIQLTKEKIENYNVNLDVQYNIVIKQQQDDGTIATIDVEGKTEEIQQFAQNDNTEILYDKTLKHEEVEKDNSVELKGKLPETAELQVEQLSEETIKEIFGDKKISVAYDIKITNNEIKKINPEEFGEICQVSIKDANISTNSKVYHVKDDNTLEHVHVTENTDGNISFEAQSFSVYAISDDEIIPDEGTETGLDVGVTTFRYALSNDGTTWGSWSSWIAGSASTPVTEVFIKDGGKVKVQAYANGSGYCLDAICTRYKSNNEVYEMDSWWYGKTVRNCRTRRLIRNISS